MNTPPIESPAQAPSAGPDLRSDKPAAIAAARVSRAGLLLGAFGLVSSVFVVVRLFATWRVTPHASHRISILGQKLSYPAANFDAVVVLFLAMLGLVVTAITVVGGVREFISARRFSRRLAEIEPLPLGDVLVIHDEQPRAFCAGLFRPRVYVSSGAVAMLDETALNAVLVHERHHARRRDPFRHAAGRVLSRALFFLPGLRELVHRQQALAELSADESAMNAGPANRSALARAMLSFSDSFEPGHSVGIDPARVDYLLGEPQSWRFPALLCVVSASAIVLVVAIAVLAGRVAVGSATLAVPFLSSQPCVVVLALIPAALGLIAVRAGRKVFDRSPVVAAIGD